LGFSSLSLSLSLFTSSSHKLFSITSNHYQLLNLVHSCSIHSDCLPPKFQTFAFNINYQITSLYNSFICSFVLHLKTSYSFTGCNSPVPNKLSIFQVTSFLAISLNSQHHAKPLS
jgi:hypothetical protein